ncbi:uncharacterized protein TRIADDRAFT_59582 [Trichoplax adhaerens]|uniref:TIR domain-containing protein n=1 Tax=Trichoplax adhaerens TaxID=10228 RepID=B3S621_TRIAD|nr:hypothetical protein TRIADDRAFT_59582 [Trichoplax adhaerens]EDV22019.1 hypothetical protein TRIADDRAFT_59582 [Trichoplax adhaerens]|eukprot:XP_002115656.1 hypothetical protein TRIADDRAFT_59582 [Trichoplax adhaerens]
MKRICNDTPTNDILNELAADGVMSSSEASKLRRIQDDNEKNFELYKILEKRGDRDFLKFCEALKNHDTDNAQELGNLLENQAKNAISGVQPSPVVTTPVTSVAPISHEAGKDTTDQASAVNDQTKYSYDVFLSHSWDNKEDVIHVKKYLESKGITCWIDNEQLSGGMKLLPEISKAILASRVFVPFMSKKYIESKNCYSEISYASDKKKDMVAVIIEDIRPQGELVSSTGTDFYIYITGDLYIKILVNKQATAELEKKLNELYESIRKAKNSRK